MTPLRGLQESGVVRGWELQGRNVPHGGGGLGGHAKRRSILDGVEQRVLVGNKIEEGDVLVF